MSQARGYRSRVSFEVPLTRSRRPPGLDLRGSSRPLSTFADHFIDETLPANIRLRAFARNRPTATLQARRRGLDAWRGSTLNEYRSHAGFCALLELLSVEGFPRDLLVAATRVVRDEAVHVELSRRMVRYLGGDDFIVGTPDYVFPDSTLDPVERAVDMVATSLCVGETYSCLLIDAARRSAVDPMSRAVLTRMAKDESFHSSFGFAALEVMWPALSAAGRRRVEARIADAVLFGWQLSTEPQPDFVDHPFGAVPPALERKTAVGAFDRLIQPRLERLGIMVERPPLPS